MKIAQNVRIWTKGPQPKMVECIKYGCLHDWLVGWVTKMLIEHNLPVACAREQKQIWIKRRLKANREPECERKCCSVCNGDDRMRWLFLFSTGNNEIVDNWTRNSRRYLCLLTIMNNNWVVLERLKCLIASTFSLTLIVNFWPLICCLIPCYAKQLTQPSTNARRTFFYSSFVCRRFVFFLRRSCLSFKMRIIKSHFVFPLKPSELMKLIINQTLQFFFPVIKFICLIYKMVFENISTSFFTLLSPLEKDFSMPKFCTSN